METKSPALVQFVNNLSSSSCSAPLRALFTTAATPDGRYGHVWATVDMVYCPRFSGWHPLNGCSIHT